MPAPSIQAEWSTVAAANLSVGGVDIYEGTSPPSNINNGVRNVMAADKAKDIDQGGSIATSGSANAYTWQSSGYVSTLATGTMIRFRASFSNTGAATLAVNSLGAKGIRKNNATSTSPLASGDIVSAQIYEAIYDASASSSAGAWILQNPILPGTLATPLVALGQAPMSSGYVPYFTGTASASVSAVASSAWGLSVLANAVAATTGIKRFPYIDENAAFGSLQVRDDIGGVVMAATTGAAARSAIGAYGLGDNIAVARASVTVGTIELNTSAKGFTLGDGNGGVSFPVPTFKPTQTSSLIAIDLFPNGTPTEQAGSGVAWIDICNKDSVNTAGLHVGIGSTSAQIGTQTFNAGTAVPLNIIGNSNIGITVATSGNVSFPTAVAMTTTVAATPLLTLTTTEDSASGGPFIKLDRNSASPAVSDFTGGVEWYARNASGSAIQTGAIYSILRTSTTAGAEGATLSLYSRAAGAMTNRANIGAGVYHTSATGGDKGDNTINFGAVYDDNVLLTDYVFDKLAGEPGDYSDAVMDRYVELDAEMFDPTRYAAYWREHRALYGLHDLDDVINGIVKEPLGAMVQRLWQTAELQAIHIDNLNQRLRALESIN